uniref:DNA-directed RNA polymerase subunit beta'' n=1 Tax=Bostrychia moritziana TaxID=103713 RepID=A0A1Z1M6N5_BOSMO|nr:RNA polymerase b''''-subunit [Bostrychia moritziana]ARW61659.1 RNA polymerase b''''-subunit [Bostrychia moritziana]
MNNYSPDMYFFNKVIDKSELKLLINWAFRNYGIARASNIADRLKDLGFFYATKGGISLSLEDLRIPPVKQSLLSSTLISIQDTDKRYRRGDITAVERFQKVIDTWHEASENLKKEVIQYFKDTDPLNSIYMMAFSGARANISQVRQLVGMRGLMADPQGQIIDLPIFHNFREGLNVTDYFISSYGARKGLVDTALRTADSGYLTRRLVDVAQDVIVREHDCKTSKGILVEEMLDNNLLLISLQQALLGRVLAEDIVDVTSNTILAKSGEVFNDSLCAQIVKLNLRNILVRSPLTCSSLNSVCQLCYGWNLAHGKMVDLGEAIGIIAAQSIGEPGTQLTMRTFHTGGVFTGELSKNIVADNDGRLEYDNNLILTKARNRHGNEAMLVHSDSKLKLIQNNSQEKLFFLAKGSLLLVKNFAIVKQGQIIAEYPLSNKLITEKAQKIIIADFSGSVHFTDFYIERVHHELKKNVVVWVLSGEVCNLPNYVNLVVSNGQVIQKNSLIASTQLLSTHSGRIYLINDRLSFSKLLLVTSSKLYTNLKVFAEISNNNDYKKYILETDTQDKFLLKSPFNRKIGHKQIIADLISNVYKTKTGGIIKYLDLSLTKNDQQNFYNVNGSGYILLIPEETHIINKDVSLLMINHECFIESGTEILQNVFANNSGFLQTVEKDGIIRELIIKPGQLYELNLNQDKLTKLRGFLRPGETIMDQINTDKLVYWEYLNFSSKHYILLRPVIIYSVPKKNLFLTFSDNSFATDTVNLKLLRRTSFKDGERVKSFKGINLMSTHLVIYLKNEAFSLKCYMQLQSNNVSNNNSFSLIKFITADFLSLKDSYNIDNNSFYSKTSLLVRDGQYIKSRSIIFKTDIFSSIAGKIVYVEETQISNPRVLVVSKHNTCVFNVTNNDSIKVSTGDWVYSGDCIAKDLVSGYSGRVIAIQNNQVIIRLGQPYLISAGSFLHISNESLIKRGESIATLIFDRFKTGDIVQGLPRIEEILEARKKNETSFNPHFMLESKFNRYLQQGLSINNSTRLSVMETQLFLVREIQLVYQAQGVYIADKHIEVIVRQMTSKVKIEKGGDTEYLPGEIVELQKIESLNQSLALMSKTQASYTPILLGITKASLNTDSFISAASFQETTKILADAAIAGKSDWLKGLKENVIIGRLIPAGTGFNTYYSKKKHQDICNHIIGTRVSTIEKSGLSSLAGQNSFEDIIVDDRAIRNYSTFKN